MKYGFKEVVLDSRTGLNPRKNFVLGNGNNNYITIKDIYDGKINITDKTDKVDDDAIQIIKKRSRIKVGDILFVSIGRIGETAIVSEKDDSWDVNESVFVFTVNEEIITPEYFCMLFRSDTVKDYLTGNSSGSTFKSIKMNQLERMVFDLPSLDIQRDITAKLVKIKDVCSLRTSQLTYFDELIKARFVEMFVSKDYPREDLDSLSYGKGEYGAQSASMEYDPSRPRYVRITDINDDGSLNEDYVCSANSDDDETYKLTYGDFCFARMGATVGKTYAYKSGNQIFAGYLIRYKLRLDKVIPEYLYEFTRLDEYWNWVLLNQSGAAQPGINAKKYGSLLIPIAPVVEQQKFAEFVKQVDKSKVAVKKALDETKLLFDSLMQEYFG